MYSHIIHMHPETPRHNKDERRHSSLEKYTSHFIWKGSKGLLKVLLCERELEAEQNGNILTPTLIAITAFLSRSPGVLNRGPSLSGTCSSFQHLLSNWSELQLLNRWSWAPPLCWVLVFSTASYLQLTDFLSSPGLYNCSTSTFFLWASQITLNQPVHGQGYILIFLDRMHLLFTQVHFLFWQLGRGQYVTIFH